MRLATFNAMLRTLRQCCRLQNQQDAATELERQQVCCLLDKFCECANIDHALAQEAQRASMDKLHRDQQNYLRRQLILQQQAALKHSWGQVRPVVCNQLKVI